MRTGYELRYKNGDIVYWCNHIQGECTIHYGMVDTQFSDVVCIDLLAPKDCRTVEGVPIGDWKPDNRIRKLPKGWSYKTILFEYGFTNNWAENDILFLDDYMHHLDITDKDKIREAYNKGYLVKSSDNCHCHAEPEIGKGTWTLQKKPSRAYGYAPPYYGIDHISVSSPKVYDNYQDAYNEKLQYEAECLRIQNLSDLEWSIEQIDRTLNHWAGLYGISDSKKKSYREFIMKLPNLEDVEVRISAEDIQWKYWRYSRWRNIEVSDTFLYFLEKANEQTINKQL